MDFEKLKALVVDTLGCDEDKVTPEASLTDDLEADSLDLVELHMALEEAAGIKIPDEKLAELHTVSEVLSYLESAGAA
ncbi:acyl carrier protein [Lachnoclostridium sp. Marseille-P6806]|uniref:acyl carrier protein n=1 Tax=Lachnoclostridium sp. Marseille-P6806 TaxID=2364793 RepID=UPI00102F8C20|nr:acyl carrier protein [Lachnoclostridium sp. Marseille-P6806]